MAGKHRKKRKLFIIFLAVIVLIAGSVTAVVIKTGNNEEEEIAYKETTAEKMNLTTGVTESGTVSIGTVSQALDLDNISVTLTTTNSSAGSSASSSSPNEMSVMGSGAMAGAAQSMSGGGSTGGNASSQSSTVSSTEDTSLVVEEIYVAAGQYVEKGEAILKIEEESLNEYKEELESAVTTAQLNLKQAQLSMELEQLSAKYTYETNIEKGKVAYETYLAELEKLEKENGDVDLTEEKLQAKQTYEETMINYNNASGILAIDTDGIEEDVENAQETLTEAQEALDKFNSCMGDGTIYADCSGKIMQVGCAEGDSLSGSSELVVYANAEDVTMAVSVSQEDISKIALGNTVNIELTAYEDEVFTGTVTDINTATSTGSSTVNYTVTVAFSGDTTKVFSGMTGSVTFVEKEVKDVLAVSNKAIINEGTKLYVKVKNDDGTIEKQEVQTGFSDGLNVEITKGLSEGETVIIESQVKRQ